MNLREPGWQKYLDEKLSILAQSITIIFGDLSSESQSKILARESLNDIIKSQQETFRNEFLLVIDSLGMAGAAEVAREEALGNLFDQ